MSKIIGISNGSLSDLEHEKTDPRADTIEKIARNTDINVHWLLTGEGPMMRPMLETPQAASGSTDARDNNTELPHMIRTLQTVMRSKDEIMKAAVRSSFAAIESAVKDGQELAKLRKDIEALKKKGRTVDPTKEAKKR